MDNKCCYGKCTKGATTEGYVYGYDENGKMVGTLVKACDTHKKKSSFFEKYKSE